MSTVSGHAATNIAITAGGKVRIVKIPFRLTDLSESKRKYIERLAAFAYNE